MARMAGQGGRQMDRRTVLVAGSASLALASCGMGKGPPVDANGVPLPQLYQITPKQAEQIPFTMLDSVNSLRSAKGAQAVAFNAALNAAALTHSRDMSVQNRPWHFGSDGSSPLVRVRRVGYSGVLYGEVISETYQTELETLSAWMADADTRGVILDPRARDLGFAWYQEPQGKIWWTMLLGG
jgi:uncharacterized protein YkwD